MEKVNCQQTSKLPSNNHPMPQIIYKPKFVEPKQSVLLVETQNMQ